VVDTNIISVDLGKLADGVAIHSGDVILCDGCQAVLNATSKPQFGTGKDNITIWICEFCLQENTIDIGPEEQPQAGSVDYILRPSKAVEVGGAMGRSYRRLCDFFTGRGLTVCAVLRASCCLFCAG